MSVDARKLRLSQAESDALRTIFQRRRCVVEGRGAVAKNTNMPARERGEVDVFGAVRVPALWQCRRNAFRNRPLSCPVEAGAEDHLAGQQPAAVRRIDAYEIINQNPVTLTLFSTGSAKMRRYQLR